MTASSILLLSALSIASTPDQPAAGALRIIVVEGEDAVNIIQQKTAVAPVVEVRDRNNLPVAGASVTFTIGGNTAAFAGGAQTLTVATNAAGQAIAAGISPLSAGAVQINVAAAFQGQTAIATIAQTNVLTAAQAAGVAGATGAGASGGSTGGTGGAATGGAAGGGGGGVSGTTIGIVGAAAAGGALAATQAGGEEPSATSSSSGPRTYSGGFAFTITLNFQGCTRLESYTGTLSITLASTEPVAGNATVSNASGRVDAVTCSGGPQLGASQGMGMPSTPVSGTAANLGFTYEASNTFPPGPNEVGGVNTSGFSFSGSLNGSEITGTLSHTRRIVGNGSSVPGTGAASAQVTLR